MGILRRLIDTAGVIGSAYLLYQKLMAINDMKNNLYQELPANLQADWVQVFGQPGLVTSVQTPQAPAVVLPKTASQISQVKAGT